MNLFLVKTKILEQEIKNFITSNNKEIMLPKASIETETTINGYNKELMSEDMQICIDTTTTLTLFFEEFAQEFNIGTDTIII